MTIANKVREAENESLELKKLHPYIVPERETRDPRVQIVIDFMNTNLQRRISLTELAGVANLSPSQLCRVFKSQTGISQGESQKAQNGKSPSASIDQRTARQGGYGKGRL